ncbi:microfibril-associated glycoprotein 4-like isoform X2 [Mytilus galloprovincialis]|uniref:microfibril-associated glycoprotein 4-like isoform X2 n=1 Tax=Mytilus galloprovincialis TaxID=29158 RepID=UPI003F7C653A
MSLNNIVLAVFIVGFCINLNLCEAGQSCLSCTGIQNQSNCEHVENCKNDEVCFVQKHTTDSGSLLYDLGCAYEQFCRYNIGGIFGRRNDAHRILCTSCCNKTRTCNTDLKCEHDYVKGLPRECSDIPGHHPDGVYKIYPDGISAVSVFCDMHTENGKWTVIQRRANGSVDFDRNWEAYKEGFGNLNGEYWLGNDVIHEITIHTRHELRIDMHDFEGHAKYAKYSMFMVGDEKGEYEMTVLEYSGNAGDSMTYHSGNLFTTFDRDNDKETRNCATLYHGGWWYNHCHDASLNGRYLSGTSPSGHGINWPAWRGMDYSLKSVKMMIRTLY